MFWQVFLLQSLLFFIDFTVLRKMINFFSIIYFKFFFSGILLIYSSDKSMLFKISSATSISFLEDILPTNLCIDNSYPLRLVLSSYAYTGNTENTNKVVTNNIHINFFAKLRSPFSTKYVSFLTISRHSVTMAMTMYYSLHIIFLSPPIFQKIF